MDQRGKRLITIAAIVILLFLGVAVYFIFFNNGSNSSQQSVSINKSLVPFDEKTLSNTNGITTIGGNTEATPTELNANPTQNNTRERLRRITPFPVSGFVSFLVKTVRIDTVIDEKTGKEKQITVPVTKHHIRYNDQRTGHIFDGIIEDESILNSKITKTNLPSAEELVFNPTGTIGYLRYEKNNKIETFKLIIPGDEKIIIPQVCITPITSDLAVKSRGEEVKILQDYINYKLSENLTFDGVFGKKTQTLIKNIQKTAGIPQTGTINQSTRDLIAKDCVDIQQKAAIANSAEPKELKGSLVSGYINQLVHNTQINTVFSLEQLRGKTIGNLLSPETGQTTSVFSSSFGEWMPQYVNKNLITMTTYAAGSVDGYMYGLNPVNQTFSKILGPLKGLTTLTNPAGTQTLISTIDNGFPVTRLVNITNGTSQSVPFVVLPEKCSWYSNDTFYCGVTSSFPKGVYPDDWYKGLVSLSDTIWSYTISTKEARQVAIPPQTLDIIKMESNPDAGYLFFINKINNELWSYRVGGED